MGEIIGRCVSRSEALVTLEDAQKHIPDSCLNAYVGALNRVRYEFSRHEPMTKINGKCGVCGSVVNGNYCQNCGRELKNEI